MDDGKSENERRKRQINVEKNRTNEEVDEVKKNDTKKSKGK